MAKGTIRKKTKKPRAAARKRSTASAPVRRAARTPALQLEARSRGTRAPAGPVFNHAMIYCRDIARSLAFYGDALGFLVVETYPNAYARLRSPGSDTTIALHVLEPGQILRPSRNGLRLYFEIEDLDAFCEGLAAKRIRIDQPPKDMPWGWRHAYLKDPDGHELSLYRAGAARLAPTATPGDH